MPKGRKDDASTEALKKLKTGLFDRGLRVAGLLSAAGKNAVRYRMAGKVDRPAAQQGILRDQVLVMVRHFNQMKGAAMKLGQLLSMYGEVFLPDDVNVVLKSLQQNSTPMLWESLKRVVIEDLGEDLYRQLEVDPKPLASASLGQVHRAWIVETGEELALKVQYPGVDRAIQSDLKVLKSMFRVLEMMPGVSHLDLLFEEVNAMLLQELDYVQERGFAAKYRQSLADDPRFVVPHVYEKYSSKRVLAMSFASGAFVDSAEVQKLSEERRQRLAEQFLELYFKELFVWGRVQTDPHFGNYRVALDPEGKNDRWVLLDFGAVRELGDDFLKNYREMILGALLADQKRLMHAAQALGFLRADDSEALKEAFWVFCRTMVEPFDPQSNSRWWDQNGLYDWAASDVPRRLTKQVHEVIRSFSLRSPPQEVVFLDRKTGGVFVLLAALGAKIDGRRSLEKILPEAKVD